MTQKEQVLLALRERGSITSWEAFQDWGITRLAAIVFVLRKDYSIQAEDVKTENRYGHPVAFAKYFVDSETRNRLRGEPDKELTADTVVESGGQTAIKI